MKRLIRNKFEKIGLNLSHIRYDTIFVIVYILGLFFGSFFAIYFKDTAKLFTDDIFIKNILTNGIEKYSLLNVFFNIARYPGTIFLFGFTAFGIFLIPIVVFLKGFFVSASISAVINTLGIKGICVAISIYGIQILITLPCVLFISSLAFNMSHKIIKSLFGKKLVGNLNTPYIIKYIFSFFIIVFLMCLLSVVDTFLTPMLVSFSVKYFF